jgi:hypothetical protein
LAPLLAPAPALSRRKSKTWAAWLALLLGGLGAHRLYLYGWRDRKAWLYVPPTLLGLAGAVRMRNLGLDDGLSMLMVPWVGLSLSVAMLAAITMALMPDEKWDARHNAGQPGRAAGWGAVFAAVVGLFTGAVLLLSTIAFGGQRFFEWQLEAAAAAAHLQNSKPLSQ